MSVCSVIGCNNTEVAKGLCMKHYKQQKRNNAISTEEKPKTCTVPGCNEKVHGKGLCRIHYNSYLYNKKKKEMCIHE